MHGGIGWAVAVYEDVQNVRPEGFELDYGIFDSGKAVSFFHLQAGRRFEVVFRTEGRFTSNDREIDRQLGGYRTLLSNCLMVSESFSARHIWANDEHELSYLRAMTHRRNERMRTAGALDDEIFPLVVKDLSEIPAKLQRATELAG